MNDVEQDNNDTGTFVAQLRENWMLLAFIAMLIASWTTLNTRLTQAETMGNTNSADIANIQSKDTTNDLRFQNLESNVYLLCKAQNLNCIPPVTQ